MTNQLASLEQRDYFYLDPFSSVKSRYVYLTIIPRARMGSESIAHEGERNNCFRKIQLVGQKNIETKHLSLVKASF